MTREFWMGFSLSLFFVVAIGLGYRALRPLHAQDSGSQFILVSGNMNNRQYDNIYLIDTISKKVAVYRLYRGSLELVDVRNIKYDLRLDFYSLRTKRSIQAVKKLTKNR